MAAVLISSDRGISLQNQMAFGRGGVQNGSFNGRVHLSNTVGNTNGECFIDGDSVSRLRFPANTSFTLVGSFFTQSHSTGVVIPTAAVFDYTFATNASGVTTITANTAPVGFTVGKTNTAVPGGGTEDVVNITGTAPAATTRFWVDVAIRAQSAVAPAAGTRQAADAATVRQGRY